VAGILGALIIGVSGVGLLPACATDVSFVPDEQTALAMGKAVLRPLVGPEKVSSQAVNGRPPLAYFATLTKAGYYFWYVENAPPARLQWATPVIRVEIDRDSGRVRYATDGVDHQWMILTPTNGEEREAMPRFVKTGTDPGHWEFHGMFIGPPENRADISSKGFIPDEDTAIEVAKAALRPLVGEAVTVGAQALPFYASLRQDGVWSVENAPPARKKWDHAIVGVQIEKRTGRIIEATDGDKNIWHARRTGQPKPKRSWSG
jgi:hypothetical protein